ncbi:MAG TPA: DUF1080 domain-containing protein [Flavitalea sp.]|nr:DUF1080 domain-containing protein [Flavitalea sp.]
MFLLIPACIISLLIATGGAFAQKASSKSLTSAPQPQNTIHLFNGKNLDGWYTFIKDRGRDKDPKSVFTVKDGMLSISGEEWGCITTDKEFENYKLVAEYKWGNKTYGTRANRTRDNGFLLHSIGEDGGYDGTWMRSIEINIIEGGTGDLLVVGDETNRFLITCPVAPQKQNGSYIFQPGGDPVNENYARVNWIGRDPNWKDEKGFRGINDVENPAGEWNRLECIVNGDQMSVYLNGTLVNQALFVRPSKGRIQIQSEGAEISYRRVDLTPLPPAPSYIPEGYKSLFNGKDLTGWKKHGTENWYAQNGEIICESGRAKKFGYLSTIKEYKDFILDVNYKQEANGNSGIFVRSTIDGTAITGWQVEVANMDEHSGGIYESGKGGRGWLIQPDPQNEKILREGEWNHMRIKVKGNEVTTWLNGTQMIHLNDNKFGAGKGFIALQIHDGGGIKVRWKDLHIKEL